MRQKSRHNWNFKVQLQDRGAQSSDLTKWRRRGKVASLLSRIDDHSNLQLAQAEINTTQAERLTLNTEIQM